MGLKELKSIRNLFPEQSKNYWIPIVSHSAKSVIQYVFPFQLCRGKFRLVLDLRYINQFLPERKFKYEGLSLA